MKASSIYYTCYFLWGLGAYSHLGHKNWVALIFYIGVCYCMLMCAKTLESEGR